MLSKITKSQMTFVPKGWGHELWIVNKPEYCGKILTLFQHKKCSQHYHQLKDETFHIQSGRILLRVKKKETDPFQEIIMETGDAFHIYPGLIHQFEGLAKESEIFEFSTQHFEDDSYRLVKGD
ncbi:MAG: cupin domain-containing protein [Planctomycetota bacterium]